MGSIFLMAGAERTAYLGQMMRSFGCTHVFLWSHFRQPSNCLLSLDAIYNRESASTREQPSSSRGTLLEQFFNGYRESVIYIDDGRIPGWAFKNRLPYMELKSHDLPRMASSQVQLQFYREARVERVVFVGCGSGEIEFGLSADPQVDLENEMKNLFGVDFQLPQPSSSPVPSLSVSSSENHLLYDIPTTSAYPLLISHPQSREDDAITKAILAVLSSASSSSSPPPWSQKRSAFSSYHRYGRQGSRELHPKPSMFKRSVLYFRNLSMSRRRPRQEELRIRPSPTQLHHMVSERRRRERLNDNFQTLRSMLPPGSKRDKASVLSSVIEYLSSLRTQVEELTKTNQELIIQKSQGGDERINVKASQVSSEARFVELRVRGGVSMMDLATRVLELLGRQTNLNLVSIKSDDSLHELTLRLRLEGDEEFDEADFQEMVRRVVDKND